MKNRITLLPENVANQIAAGEVVQRPASAVKELMENAIDAGATSILVNIVDSGKSLIQVIDNGDGMSETDIRMAFERHATSKISKAEDLFDLSTKGFRGEALASIAAVAQVHCISKTEDEEMASEIRIEGNKVISQSYTSGKKGSSISVKNLFFNIPARRNFLKSNQVEFKHIVDEFERVALPHPDIQFRLVHNESEIFNLNSGNFRQRIVSVFGKKFNERLVPIDENTDLIKISGFLVKPQFSRRTRGEQFFFVNKRFIKSPFLHRAILSSFEGLISADQYPAYFVAMDIDPSKIDVNIHPTKTEIKFEDEHSIFAILKSAVKHSLGQFNVVPSIDFDADLQFQVPPPKENTFVPQPRIDVDPDYNPFNSETVLRTANKRAKGESLSHNQQWEKLYEGLNEQEEETQTEIDHQQETVKSSPLLLNNKYIAYSVKSGMMIVDIKRALECIYYNDIILQFKRQSSASQQLLFPIHVNLNAGEMKLIKELETDFSLLGFDFEEAGLQGIVVNGIPMYLSENDTKEAIEQLLDSAKDEDRNLEVKIQQKFAKKLSIIAANKHNSSLSVEEQNGLIDRLFACENPYLSMRGKATIAQLSIDELEKYFN